MPTYTYLCQRVQQRVDADAPRLILFSAPAAEVVAWCRTHRLDQQPAAHQRPESPSKIAGVTRFFRSDLRNVIPSAIIVTLSTADAPAMATPPPADGGELNITVPDANPDIKPGLIVDGQHRVLGARQFAPDLRLVVVALLDASLDEAAFQFLVMNNKATKVPTDHVRALVGELSQQSNADLDGRLASARLSLRGDANLVLQVDRDDNSPFRNMIAWPANRTGPAIVVPAGIETAVAYVQSRRVRDLSDSEDNLLGFFYAVWGTVRDRWPDLWVPDSRLLQKVGVVCLNQYLTDSLIALSDWGGVDLRDPEDISRQTRTLLQYQSPAFWTAAWTTASLDTKAGRDLVIESLKAIARNLRAGERWNEDVDLVDRASLDPESESSLLPAGNPGGASGR